MSTSTSAKSLWINSPRSIELRESILPPPEQGQVQVRAICSAISHGTEMLVYRGEVPADLALDLTLPTQQGSYAFPIKYGYASVGQVIAAGKGAGRLATGDFVFAFNPHESQYTIDQDFVVKLPPEVDPYRAVFLANIETAINVLLDAAPRIGERVLVFGQGVVGLLIAQLARRAGAGQVITADPLSSRRTLSLALGASCALDPSSSDFADCLRQATEGKGADVVIEASGHPGALQAAIEATAFGGLVVVVSWHGSKRASVALGGSFHRNRITVQSSQVSTLDSGLAPRWTLERRRELACAYLDDLRLDELLTHKFAFENAASAYDLIDQHPDEVIQAVLVY